MWKIIVAIHLMSGACVRVGQSAKDAEETLLQSMQKAMRTFYEPMWFLDPDYNESLRLKDHVLNPMFSIARGFMQAVTRNRAYPPRAGLVPYPYINVEFGQVLKEWPKMIEHYTFIVFLMTVVALLVVGLPIFCVFWSCYWCVWGNRPELVDRRRRSKLLCGFSALLMLYLFCVVLVFESESAVECATGDAFIALHRGVNDSLVFLAHTQYFLEWLLMHSFTELRRRSLFITRALGEMAAANITMDTRAVSMNRITNLVDRLQFMKASYGYLRTKTDVLRSNADHLNEGLQSIQRQIHKTLSTCDQLDCTELRDSEKLRLLDNGIYFDEMVDVSEKMDQVSALLAGKLREEVAEGVNVLRDMQHSIRRAALVYVPLVTRVLNAIAHHLTSLVRKLRSLIRKMTRMLVIGHRKVDQLSQHFHRYGAFRQYIGIGAAIAMLLIFAIMLWGVLLCVFGSDTVSCRTAGCCDRTTGASSLIWGVRVIFVLTGFVALTVVIYFIIAVVIQRFVCDPYTEPRNNRVFMDMEKLVGTGAMLKNLGCGNLNMSTVLERIHQNRTLFEVMNMQELLDLEALSELIYATTRRLNALPPLRPVLGDNIVFLKDSTIKKLRHCADAQLLDFNFEEFRSAIHLRVSPRQLHSLAQELNRTALTLRQPEYEREALELMQASARLFTLANSVLRPALRTVRDLSGMDNAFPPSLLAYADLLNQGYDISDLAQLLSINSEAEDQDQTKQPSKQEKDPIESVDEVQEAEEKIETEGERLLKAYVNETLFKIRVKIVEYMEGVRHVLTYDAARSGPLSRVLNATAAAICEDLLLPINGYWLSLFFCLVLLPAVALTAQRVARLHLHVHPCPGHVPRIPEKDTALIS